MCLIVAATAGTIGIRIGSWWAGSRRSASERIDADIAFIRAMPASDEGALADESLAVQLCRTWLVERGMSPEDAELCCQDSTDCWSQLPPQERQAWRAVAQRARELAQG
ncbi:hypothetical protein GCM10023114_36410 [Mycolicibacterium sediminis]|uniref:Uncharacterized protein n=2 Tax=Mycolicibacterium sediminis TaxID=1286180 RepID=A0A7I7QZ98_9MYCO|nr:hypothetical protein MSEDJ_54030 [Mycolicibacterium sediminis]